MVQLPRLAIPGQAVRWCTVPSISVAPRFLRKLQGCIRKGRQCSAGSLLPA